VFGSFRLGSVLGITIRLHFLLLIMIVVMAFNQVGVAVWNVLVMLGIVLLLHELGHSLVARRFGIRVLDITLWPLGGMARMSEMPESSKIEGLIAVAGPAVNFLLAALATPLLLVPGIGHGIVQDFVLLNLGMGSLNLIPVFPTDGGRILRALFALRGNWLVATERAVLVSRVIAVMLGAYGFASNLLILPVLALWLWWTGSQELAMVRLRHASPAFAPFAAFETAADSARSTPRHETPRAHAGFSQDDIERLEKFRGSLRQFERGP
jgi:Zn-dependent protease